MPEELTIQPWSAQYQEEVIELILPIQRNEFAIPVTREDQPD